jgi:hypothetical protein
MFAASYATESKIQQWGNADFKISHQTISKILLLIFQDVFKDFGEPPFGSKIPCFACVDIFYPHLFF